MENSKHFGNLKVGTIIDCNAAPSAAARIAAAARDYLEKAGADLIVTNQSHGLWRRAFRDAGFFSGPSNFIFAASPELAKSLNSLSGCHITRGDGDGPVHL
jgi:hypothetical protein